MFKSDEKVSFTNTVQIQFLQLKSIFVKKKHHTLFKYNSWLNSLANLFLCLRKTQISLNITNISFFRWENKNTKDNISKEEILGKYFGLLTDQEIMKLYKIYEDDFRNFGYKFNFRSLKLS